MLCLSIQLEVRLVDIASKYHLPGLHRSSDITTVDTTDGHRVEEGTHFLEES